MHLLVLGKLSPDEAVEWCSVGLICFFLQNLDNMLGVEEEWASLYEVAVEDCTGR